MRRLFGVVSVAIVVLLGGVSSASAAASPPCTTAPAPVAGVPSNPFGANVTIFNPSMSVASINAALNAASGNQRRQFFFLPGTYGDPSITPATATTTNVIQAQVASGTKVSGLGASPCDVVINGALDIKNGGLAIRPSQMSNLTINPIESGSPDHSMLWYTSQTATWRRVNLLGNLYVSPVVQSPGKCQNPCTNPADINLVPGVANGFVMASSVVTGKVINGDGLNRPGVEGFGGNSDIYFQQDSIGGYTGFGSDMVFAGTLGAPPTDFRPGVEGPNGTFAVTPGHITTVDTVPVVREEPYVYYDGTQFRIFRPSAQFDVRGPNWDQSGQGDSLPLSAFYIANPTTPASSATPDTAATINAQLAAGKHIILNPGTYVLNAPLTVASPDKVIFGLGDPILRADNTATIIVKDSAPGTVLGGFNADGRAFNASDMGAVPFAENQVVIGDTPHGAGSKTDPTSLNDISSVSGAKTDVLINQDYVVMNQGQIQSNNNSGNGYTTTNWAADSSTYGMVVNGDHFTWEGIWLEHFKKTQVTWNGEDGQVLFFQNERPLTVPFDVPGEIGVQPHVWKLAPDFDGYPALAVANSVNTFTLHGFQSWSRLGNGCYCNVTSLITTPVKPGVRLYSLFTGMILGSTPPGTTPTGTTVGGVFNLVNKNGVASTTPFSVGPWGATSAWPYSDVAGHANTARMTSFPTTVDSPGTVGGSVPATLALSLGGPATFGAFTPGGDRDYLASTTANVISTAGDAALSVADPSAAGTGRLVNGAFSLAQAVQASASSAGGTGSAFAPVGGSAAPTALLTYSAPTSNDAVTLTFKQTIGRTEALRTGAYGKTLTFTLSTTTP